MIELRVLGSLDLRAGAGPLSSVLVQPKRLALLVYIALAPAGGFRRRDTLTGLFWPESDGPRARRALNQAIYVLRQSLGDVLLARGEDDVGLDPTRFRCDAVAFAQHLAEGNDTAALELYQGDLLAGFFLDDCAEFEQWLERERARLNDDAVAAAVRLAEREHNAGNEVGGLHWLRRSASWASYSEPVHAKLIRALDALGDRAGALREFDTFRSRLGRDLEVEPSVELVAFARELRAREVNGEPAARPEPISPAVPLKTVPRARARRQIMLLALPGLLLLLMLAASRAILREPAGTIATRQRVLIAEFDNQTGDVALASLSRIAADWISQGLAQTGWTDVVSPLGLVRAARATDSTGTPVTRAPVPGDRVTLVISGSFVRVQDDLIFQARVIDAASGNIERAVSSGPIPAAEPLRAVEEIRQRVLGALATMLDVRLASWSQRASQPPSLQAYQRYNEGMDRFADGNMDAAAHRFREAAALDATFTAPLVWALVAYWERGDFPRSDTIIAALQGHRETLPPWDRAMLEFLTARHRGQSDAAMRAIRRVSQIAPESEWLFEHARQALQSNRPREALAVIERLDPARGWLKERPNYWMLLANVKHAVEDYVGELTAAQQLSKQTARRTNLPSLRALAALGRVDDALADAQWTIAHVPPGYMPSRMLLRLILELRERGNDRAANDLIADVLAWYESAPAKQKQQLLFRQQWAEFLWLAGRTHEARLLYERGLREDPPRPLDFGGAGNPVYFLYAGPLGMIAAAQGDSAAAHRYDRLIESNRGPYDFGENSFWRAGIAAHLGEKERAVALLRQAFSEGYLFTDWFFVSPALRPLRGYPPFEALIQPRG